MYIKFNATSRELLSLLTFKAEKSNFSFHFSSSNLRVTLFHCASKSFPLLLLFVWMSLVPCFKHKWACCIHASILEALYKSLQEHHYHQYIIKLNRSYQHAEFLRIFTKRACQKAKQKQKHKTSSLWTVPDSDNYLHSFQKSQKEYCTRYFTSFRVCNTHTEVHRILNWIRSY